MTKRAIVFLGVLFFLLPMLVHAGVLILGPADFQPYSDNNDYFMNSERLYSESGAIYRYFYAPVHLPDGAKITRVLISYYDNSASSIEVSMFRMNIWGGNSQQMFSSSTTGEADYMRKDTVVGSTISYKWINGKKYIYSCRVYFSSGGSNLKLYAVKIDTALLEFCF